MFNRQKLLLFLLSNSNRGVSKTELMKWAFLLSKDSSIADSFPFYEFLPYKYGPFSFCLYRDMEKLISQGFVTDEKNDKWKATSLCKEKINELNSYIKNSGTSIISKWKSEKTSNLIDYVYHKYPEYTFESKIKKLAKRPVAKPAIFTSGYEKLSVDGFLDRLMQNGVERIIDVRANPIARRYGFHKSTLSRLAGNVGIQYVHIPELGISSKDRQGVLSKKDFSKLFDNYTKTTLRTELEAISLAVDLISEKPSVLVCMEAQPEECHRSRLAKLISKRTGLDIINLGCSCK